MLCKGPLQERLTVKKLLLTAALLLSSVVPVFAAKPQPKFTDTLSKATLAVYAGEQVCGYKPVDLFYGTLDIWSCEFKTKFTCTATVIRADGRGNYAGLTAGHCFSYELMDKGVKYFVSESLSEHPVLNKIRLVKFANEPRYDYAIFTFRSLKDYPAIEIEKGNIPGIGTEVENANFSLGVVKQVEEGKVVSTQITGHEDAEMDDLQGRFFVSIGVGPGASGSAIVDKKTHKIIGLVEAVFPGGQMATVAVPLGQQFINFVDDASAGIRPQAPKGPVVKFHQEPPAPKAPVLSFWELLKQLILRLKFWS